MGFKHIKSKDSPYIKGEFFDTFEIYREDGFNTGLYVWLETFGKKQIKIKIKTEYVSSWGGGKTEISLNIKNKSELKVLMKQIGI